MISDLAVERRDIVLFRGGTALVLYSSNFRKFSSLRTVLVSLFSFFEERTSSTSSNPVAGGTERSRLTPRDGGVVLDWLGESMDVAAMPLFYKVSNEWLLGCWCTRDYLHA